MTPTTYDRIKSEKSGAGPGGVWQGEARATCSQVLSCSVYCFSIIFLRPNMFTSLRLSGPIHFYYFSYFGIWPTQQLFNHITLIPTSTTTWYRLLFPIKRVHIVTTIFPEARFCLVSHCITIYIPDLSSARIGSRLYHYTRENLQVCILTTSEKC